jgi:hypothetical protein
MIKIPIIESLEYPNFYKIKDYDKYLISKDGLVLNISKNTCLNGSVNPDGYHNFRLTRNDGYCYTWGLHRLLCYVFKSEDGFNNSLTVNHIDGNKSNNDLLNLEWCTYKEQQEHAGRLGLTNKCSPLLVKDLKTNEILEFPSIIECAKFYNVSKDFINWRTKKPPDIIWPELKQYKLLKDVREWGDNKLSNNGNNKFIFVKFLLTGNIKSYLSIKDASNDLKVKVSTLSQWLNKENQPVLPGLIQVKYQNDLKDWRYVSDPYKELEFFTKQRVVKVINPITNEIKIFESASKAAENLKISQTCLNYRLKNNNGKVFPNNFICEYYSH